MSDYDDRKVQLVRKWLHWGARHTGPLSTRNKVIRGKGRKRKVIATDTIGAIEVGRAKSIMFKDVKYKVNTDEFFWRTVDHLLSAYRSTYGTWLIYDMVSHSRNTIIERIDKL